jgi:hypothetical protein
VIADLARELTAVGIRGRLRARILAEAQEHVREGSAEAFGDPRALAVQFAEELGPVRARRAAWGSLAALALSAAAYTLAFWKLQSAPARDILGDRFAPLGLIAAVGLILLPQVSFATGILAPFSSSPRVALRRAAVGVAAAAASLACAVAVALEYGVHEPVLWALAPAGAALAVAFAATVRAARIRTAAPPRDLDLSWRAAFAVAALVALAVGIAGSSGGDPFEGVRNAVVESIACLSGFAVLGKYVGLRR